ncbi:MAG: CopG family antitoxin [Crocosphaera sp.]|nr:CopG family antitoxin [Crocosphaera sp.]
MNNKDNKPEKPLISAEELDKIFDEGEEDIIEYLDFSTAHRPGLEENNINIALPEWMINRIDLEAKRLGISSQLVIRNWLTERLDKHNI